MKNVLLLFAACFLISLLGCARPEAEPVPDLNSIIKDFRPHNGFSEIRAGKAVELRIKVGGDFSVTVERPENASDDVKTEVEDGVLIVSSKPQGRGAGRPLMVDISLPELRKLDVWGSSIARVENVKSDSLTLQAGGDSKITIDGEAANLKFVTTGVSRIDAENLRVSKSNGTAVGVSIVNLASPEELEAEAHGASRIYFAENPKKLTPMIVGSGKIEKR